MPTAPAPLLRRAAALVNRNRSMLAAAAGVCVVVAAVELWMGRLPLGPDGRFGWWEGNIWSAEQSQRVADPYTFSHTIHGMLFYAILWLVARRSTLRARFIGALVLEGAWEVLENSPIIINRYREATIALGYVGDSVLNSVSDVCFAACGFLFAWRARPWLTVAVILAMELGTLVLMRDNLTLNIVMLIHPIEAIKEWQMAGRPLP
ncbi:MAG: hypothetical protein H6Q10_778 [Acidobacteria bacterium]|nr:hypothetical protein [Acidobacteriota bacterium]